MKLNNKGMTLVELLISIALIGIVLTFLFQMLNDLHLETENNNYAYNNQINWTDTIYTIQKDLKKYTLTGIEDASTGDNIIIKFYFSGKTTPAILQSDYDEYTEYSELGDEFEVTKKKYYLRYTSFDQEEYSWEMKGAEINPCANFVYYKDNNSKYYYFKINIPIYNNPLNERNNKDRNNAVDDIEITYSNYLDDLILTNGSYLTGNAKIEKQIGYCTD